VLGHRSNAVADLHSSAATAFPDWPIGIDLPSITGWAQINGRNAISWEEKFKLDVWYVDNQSFWLDLKIIWFTIRKVLVREGINQDGQVTMEPFRGSES